MTYAADLTVIGTRADAEIANLTASVSAAVTIATQEKARADKAVQDLADHMLTHVTPPPPPPVPTDDGVLPVWGAPVWRDEFTGTTVDTTKWNIRNNTTQANMDGTNLADHVTVKDGVLSFHSGPAVNGKWPCGYLDTNGGKFAQQYGRWEARMRVPWGSAATGFWPAFWLRPIDGGDGEIDIMEAWPAKNEIGPTTHSGYSLGKHVGYRAPCPPLDPGTWHNYAVEWKPGSMVYLIDNKAVYTVPYTTDWVKAIYDRGVAYSIRLNLQMGGTWGGKPTVTTDLTKTFDVEWVRAYAYKP